MIGLEHIKIAEVVASEFLKKNSMDLMKLKQRTH